jgi:hypothetical protein
MAKNTKEEMEGALEELIHDHSKYDANFCIIPWEWWYAMNGDMYSAEIMDEVYGLQEAYLSSKLYPKEFGGF